MLGIPEVRSRLDELGVNMVAGDMRAFDAHVRAEFTRWAPVIEAAGVKIE